jgi:hypothetical protein
MSTTSRDLSTHTRQRTHRITEAKRTTDRITGQNRT